MGGLLGGGGKGGAKGMLPPPPPIVGAWPPPLFLRLRICFDGEPLTPPQILDSVRYNVMATDT